MRLLSLRRGNVSAPTEPEPAPRVWRANIFSGCAYVEASPPIDDVVGVLGRAGLADAYVQHFLSVSSEGVVQRVSFEPEILSLAQTAMNALTEAYNQQHPDPALAAAVQGGRVG